MEEALGFFSAGPVGLVFVWVIVYMAFRGRRYQADAQKEVQLALLNKFSSGDELTRFLATDEGRRLVDHLSSPFGNRDPHEAAPKMVIGACILLMLAIGFAVLVNSSQSQYQQYAAPAVICGSLGIGFLFGAAMMSRLAAKKDLDRKGDR